jgi:hypothetical protein
MASTIKELIEFLSKYENKDTEICWQFYTKDDFYVDEDEGEITEEDFAEIRHRFEKQDGWSYASEMLSDLVNEQQAQKINQKGQN